MPKTTLTSALESIKPPKRIKTSFPAFDKLLGGGLSIGSSLVVGGPPGVGKSTLVLQILAAAVKVRLRSIYASGEQSEADLAIFMRRVAGKVPDRVKLVGDVGDVYRITDMVEHAPKREKPAIVVVDSIHTAYVDDVKSDFGSRSQMMAVANYMTAFAARTQTTVVFIAHENKDGTLRLPIAVKHLIDVTCCIQIDDEQSDLREFVFDKNRYGLCGSAKLKMTAAGLVNV